MWFLLILLSWGPLGFTWPWDATGPWPDGSDLPLTPLDRPQVEEVVAEDAANVRYAVFGDQRALADGEWQDLVAAVAQLHQSDPIDFVIDTGDIVQDGRHSDQFEFLRGILEPIDDLPYLVSVGNHETKNNLDPSARFHTSIFLGGMDPAFTADRYYFRKDLANTRFLFLDSNDLVYGDDGAGIGREEPVAGSRAAAQMHWLETQLTHPEPPGMSTVVVIHHPFVQTSKKHQEASIALWNYGAKGRKLRDLFLEGGVDLILAGHTHTYERFLLEKDGHRMHLLNVSGRPRTSFLWVGDGARRPKDIRGEESEWFEEEGWDLDGWTVTQEAVMLEDEEDQFALIESSQGGPVTLEVRLLDDDDPSGTKLFESVVLK
ncbi:MAG: metallophosphoesterase [Candidatus Eisenbacteria bacterium]|nr:metallophosphoesterase [Candidatus Eisenbacteria bacterium]